MGSRVKLKNNMRARMGMPDESASIGASGVVLGHPGYVFNNIRHVGVTDDTVPMMCVSHTLRGGCHNWPSGW